MNGGQIHLVLALVESGATDTPYFSILDSDELIESIVRFVLMCEKEFQKDYHKSHWRPENYLKYLCGRQEFNIELDKLKETIEKIKEIGEDYEFRAFKKMG